MTETLAPPKLPDTALCIGCNYALRGLTEHRCPECGRAFDPADDQTFNSGPPPPLLVRWSLRPAGWILRGWAIVAALALATSPYDVLWRGEVKFKHLFRLNTYIWEPNHVTVLLWVGLLLFWMLRTSWRKLLVYQYRKPRALLQNDRPARRLTSTLFLISFALSFCILYQCPHAQYWSIWGLGGIAHGPTGPCYHNASWSAHLVGNWYVFAS